MQVIYIDILFFINLTMDLIIFSIAINFLGKKISKVRWIIGSLIAAILYCLIIYFPLLQLLPYYIYYLFIPVIPILYIFEPMCLKEFLKYFMVCSLSAFIIGGGTFNIYYLLEQCDSVEIVNYLLPIIVGISISFFVSMSFSWIRKRMILPQFEYDITLHNLGEDEQLKGIVDTGNCLYTLINHKPVTITSFDKAKKILGEDEKNMLDECKNRGIIQTLSEKNIGNNPLTIIPFKSVGCKEGMILGVQIDKMSLKKGEFEREYEKCILGICFDSVFQGYEYEILVHPDFIIN